MTGNQTDTCQFFWERARGSAEVSVYAMVLGLVHPIHALLFPAHEALRTRTAAGPDGAIGAVVARFVHTEEVTGSNPVSPTLPRRASVPGQQ